MTAAILIIIAAIFKAIADTLAHHFDTSIFRNKPRNFWEANRVHKTVKQIFGYPVDAWHISNSIMIIAFLCAAIFNTVHWEWYWQLLAGGGIFNLTFNIFYNEILR